ncbi:complement C1q-like protein 2 [Engraulis encrasicolus]|uniref:complement C1q-like protein 2 n=1 Tax=Engraulis encrasicolus TaxID=184585 RepID=UPI002FD51B48
MRAAISLLMLLFSICGAQTRSTRSTEVSAQLDVSAELKELRDMVVEQRVILRYTQDNVKVLEAENVAVAVRLAVSETKVQTLERALQDTKAEMKTEVDNLKKENAAQETELTAVKTRLAATETEVENLEKEIKAAPKVAFSAGLGKSGNTVAGSNVLNLVFSRVITNVGQAYSSTTGFFTAPISGVYYFRFTVMDYLDNRGMAIRMYKNGRNGSGSLMDLYEYDADGKPSILSSGLTLQLEKGEAVNMVLPAGYRLYDDTFNRSTFSGFLLFPL